MCALSFNRLTAAFHSVAALEPDYNAGAQSLEDQCDFPFLRTDPPFPPSACGRLTKVDPSQTRGVPNMRPRTSYAPVDRT